MTAKEKREVTELEETHQFGQNIHYIELSGPLPLTPARIDIILLRGQNIMEYFYFYIEISSAPPGAVQSSKVITQSVTTLHVTPGMV